MTTERYELVEGYMEFAPEDGKWVHWSDYSKMRSAHLVEVHSLKSRIAELEKDAARFEWCVNQYGFVDFIIHDTGEFCDTPEQMRQAIDTAMQKD